ncbi:hypothetical protein ScalyP_jg5303 [Parmales sp. scaly parma]|nr:hypothetical protein ScalyP_jg5303 [Parmales sp. scaly parma]
MEELKEERRKATRQLRLLGIYISTNALMTACYTNPYGEYILQQAFDGDIVWAAQMGVVNNLVLYLTRLLIGAPMMGVCSDVLGRRVSIIIASLVALASGAVFIWFPSLVTMLGGSFLTGVFVREPIEQSYLADLTRVFVRTDSVVAKSVSPADREVEVTQGRFGKKSSKLIGRMLACYTFSFATGSAISAVLTYKDDGEEEEGGLGTNSTNTTDIKNVCDELDEETIHKSTNHLMPSFYASLLFGTVCCLMSLRLGKVGVQICVEADENKSKAPTKITVAILKESSMFLVNVMLKIPFVRLLCIILFLMKLIESGALNIFYYYGKFQFDWSTSTFGLFLVILIFANAWGNTAMVSTFNKMMNDQWDISLICASFLTVQFVMYCIASTPTMFIIGALFNIFNFIFAIMRGKIFANFQPDEYGKVAGGMEVLQSLGSVVGPLLAAAVMTWGIEETGVPECLTGADKYYFSAAAPWVMFGIMTVLTCIFIPIGKRMEKAVVLS